MKEDLKGAHDAEDQPQAHQTSFRDSFPMLPRRQPSSKWNLADRISCSHWQTERRHQEYGLSLAVPCNKGLFAALYAAPLSLSIPSKDSKQEHFKLELMSLKAVV